MKARRRAWAEWQIGVRVHLHPLVGITEIPGKMIEITEHVAAGARNGTVRGAEGRIVEESTPLLDRRALRREEAARREHVAGGDVDDADRVGDPRVDE